MKGHRSYRRVTTVKGNSSSRLTITITIFASGCRLSSILRRSGSMSRAMITSRNRRCGSDKDAVKLNLCYDFSVQFFVANCNHVPRERWKRLLNESQVIAKSLQRRCSPRASCDKLVKRNWTCRRLPCTEVEQACETKILRRVRRQNGLSVSKSVLV